MAEHLLLFTFYIITIMCLSIGKAELCIDQGVEFDIEYARVGEPLYADCPLQFLKGNNFSVAWIRNDTQTEITSDKEARVHQDQNLLKFIPADLHDSGFYQCIFRNSTMCTKKIRRVLVFKYHDGLCYNHSVKFPRVVRLAPSLTIQCPKLDNYGFIPVKWFKECQPLDVTSDRYITTTNTLTIKDLSMEDHGNYTCEAPYIYNGVTYNLSRTMEYTILDPEEDPDPIMIFPKNNLVDVELGAPITLTCEVLHNGSPAVFWIFNETLMSNYADDRVKIGDVFEKVTDEGKEHFLSLNFTTVIEEDYNRQFYCYAWTTKAIMFYVTLKKPDPKFQGFLIAFFVSMFLVTVIVIIAIRIFKVDLVLWYRSSCFARTDQKDGKIYDAYIIYPKHSRENSSHEMDIFVLKVLPEVLEKQCAYRLFILGRDELPGQALTDLVDDTISQSRRVIIILENMSCETRDEESDFEQRIAMYDALIRNQIKVILIEIEKITDYKNMPESIKYIKQKQGVVRWKGEFTEEALSPNTRFWKNIRYRMPPAQRYSDKEQHYIHS